MLTQVPVDVLHHGIMPCLDYMSRQDLNAILPAEERRIFPLNRSLILTIETQLSVYKLRSIIETLASKDMYAIYKTLQTFRPRYMGALVYCTKTRQKILNAINKVLIFIRFNQHISGVSAYIKKKVTAQVEALLEMVNKQAPLPLSLQDIRPAKDLPPVHTVEATVPTVPQMYLPCYFDIMDVQIEQQLQHGRGMMEFWRLRGDFH